jgi:CheY-like chemotaxis protein
VIVYQGTLIMHKPLVLIVEDNFETSQLLQMLLHRSGFETAYASNGTDALYWLSHSRPDVMILDLGMPDMSGWNVLDRLKVQQPHADFPVVVLTAFDDPANKLVGKMQGRVYSYLTKPFKTEALVHTLQAALAAPAVAYSA